MVRRTISLPEDIDSLIKENAQADESFSATVVRLVLAGATAKGKKKRLLYVGAGEGPRDLGLMAERYLRELVEIR